MVFYAVLDQVIALLRSRRRVSYGALKRQFGLDDAYLADLKVELIEVHQVATDHDGIMLVWTGAADPASGAVSGAAETTQPPAQAAPPDAERRQLTVLFCDLVDSTRLASQLDPEDLREVVRAYQATCAKVIARFEGHIAQYLGDGLLVYFGYPLAHEDDAQRAVRAGLGIVEAVGQLNARLEQERGVQLAVRLGIHTGLVVVGEVGSDTRQEQLALGETPNLAARLQGIATPDTLVISAATFQLLGGFFACQPLGTPLLKGLAQPLVVYRVLYESMARSRLEAAGSTGLTPLVGREQDIVLLRERWAQVKEGVGQVVLLSGEAGIGKSRLMQVLKEQVASEPQAWLTPCQCSPYHQHTALYPMIELLERVALRFEREASPQHKLSKLEGFLVQYGLPLAATLPLFTTLLSLPLPVDYAPLLVSPEQQKQQTLHALMTILLRISAQQPVLFVMEDLHWVDPSTLEFLSLLVAQGPTARILALFTCRPDFSPPWTGRAHLTHVTVTRLPRQQAVEVIHQVAHGKALPPEVVEQIVAKTDGVPLFVEELTKMVLGSDLLQEREDCYALTGPLPPLAIPATLHDSLMARLDRLATVKALAQLGAMLGREFSYELLQAVSPWDEEAVRRGLHQLVEAEFLYQRGIPPQAIYLFKHALIQDTAYQSLLRSTRQQHHQHIAQVLEGRFPEVCKMQPELLAHHYTEAGMLAQAIPYWQRAGQHAIERSANVEAISHLTTALELLQMLPDAPELVQQELDVSIALGIPLVLTKGYAAPEVEATYTRARELCRQLGDTPQLFPVLVGLRRFYFLRGALQTAHDLDKQLLRLAERLDDRGLRLRAHHMLVESWLFLGEFVQARTHAEQGIALYNPQQHRAHAVRYGNDSAVGCRVFGAEALWVLGYPDQALRRIDEALTWAQELAHPSNLAFALHFAAWFHQLCREPHRAQEQAEAAIALARERGFVQFLALSLMLRGWTLAEQGQVAEGLAQIRQGMADMGAIGAQIQPRVLMLLANVYGHMGQPEEELRVLAEAETVAQTRGERFIEAELSRCKGELLLQQAVPDAHQAETCLQQALAIACRQQAKSLELRAAMSLARLWQSQGKRAEARELLVPVYHWFTEGFETADLQEAKTLLEGLQG